MENLEVDGEMLGSLDSLVLLQVEVGGREKMEVRKRPREETPKLHLWASVTELNATGVAYPFLNLHQGGKHSRS